MSEKQHRAKWYTKTYDYIVGNTSEYNISSNIMYVLGLILCFELLKKYEQRECQKRRRLLRLFFVYLKGNYRDNQKPTRYDSLPGHVWIASDYACTRKIGRKKKNRKK